MPSVESSSIGMNYQTSIYDTCENINQTLKDALQSVYEPEPMRLSEWAEENFYLSPESSSISGAWENIPYQVGIMDCISNDDIAVITWMKSARTGYTKIIVAAVGYFAEHKQRGQLIYQPTDSDAQDFVKDEINPMTRDVPSIRNIFPHYGKKDAKNTLNKKVFQGSTLDVLGGTSPRNYRRYTKDIVYYDELDGFEHDIGGEGSSTSLGDTRITTSSFPKSIRGSTPKIKESSQIEASLAEADILLRYEIPCPHCDEMQHLKWGGDKAEFGIKWEDDNPETAHYCCEHCKEKIDYSLLSELLEKGEWRSECGVHLGKEGEFYSGLKAIDAPYHVGFHLWSAYSIFSSWVQLVSEYLKAVKDSKNGNLSKLKTFVNTRLGESWEEDQGEKIEPSALHKRREHYAAELPKGVVYLTAGVDTQDDRFEYVVKGWGVGEEEWAVDYVRLYGDLSRPEIWNVLAERLRRTYKRFDGAELGIETICHDSGGHFTDEVYEFSKKHGLTWIIPIKGASQPGKPIATFPTNKNAKGVYLTEIGTDNAKNLIYQRLNILDPGPGYCHWPINDNFDETYFDQLTVEKKALSYSRGKRVFVWVLPNGRRNEALDCSVYALAALRISVQYKSVNLERLAYIKSVKKETKEIIKKNFIKEKKGWIK